MAAFAMLMNCSSGVHVEGVAAPLSAASHGVGSAQGSGVQQGSQGAGTLGLRNAFPERCPSSVL